jgi:hypothetical protein
MLWLYLTAGFYLLFTLMPDSHSVMVQWPWVAFWQIGLLFPIFWLLSQIWHAHRLQPLGNKLDWLAALIVFSLGISVIGARFPAQARWYGWAALGVIIAVYALHQWLLTPNNSTSIERRLNLLTKQGYLNIAFILLSLSLWLIQTVLPELARLEQLKPYGVDIPFDFSVLELRNWAPLGHQNYVAGYLLLALPLLLGLGFIQTDARRWLWWGGWALGIVNLYTTSSRGGLLGLVGLLLVGGIYLAAKTRLSRLWLGLGSLGVLAFLGVYIQTNNRLKSLLLGLFSNQGDGELAFRRINALIGWKMGTDNPFTGIGLGGVPLNYQKFHPPWAGRASELVYQLHSTPIQMFAEMGLWGILCLGVGLILFLWLLWRHSGQKSPDSILMGCLAAALFAYGLMSLTDFQLDNIAISGTLVIYVACLASFFGQAKIPSLTKIPPLNIFYGGLGLVLAALIWLLPIHRAWQLSSQGFQALANDKVNIFTEFLTQAQRLAPWEPYYPLQLGWNLGNLALENNQPQLLPPAVEQFRRGNQISPYQEFGHSNLAWLQLQQNNPVAAQQSFSTAVKLLPAKSGNFYGLGLSLLGQNKRDLGIDALVLEALRNPLTITSPTWRSPNLQPLYQQILNRLALVYTSLLQNPTLDPSLVHYLHQARGAVSWWQGNFPQAHRDWDKHGNLTSQKLLALAEGKPTEEIISQLPQFGLRTLLEAWQNPEQRPILIPKAWVETTKTALPQELQTQFLGTMRQGKSFFDWLENYAPSLQYRRQRAGFGVLSRHIDGTQPLDFVPLVENIAVKTWLTEIFPTQDYSPLLDELLQPLREKFLNTINP